jgi:hypothetical protein
MPRSPTVYNLPAATVPKVPLETISSAQWNAAMNDIAATFNTPQPIAYGGTGATTVITAHDAITTKGTDVATAATLNLDTATGQFVDLTGTTTVTAVTLADGKTRLTRSAAAFQITVGASLIGNNGGSNVPVEAGDLIIWEGYAAGVVRFWLTRASGRAIVASAYAPPKGHLYGLTLANNATDATNDVDIAAGEASSDATTPTLITLATGVTKRLDAAWAVGTGNGGLDTGSIANTTYHLWLIQRSDTGVVDVLFSTSATSPTMPTNYDRKRRVGAVLRESGAIVAFVQDGDYFRRKASRLDVDVTQASTTATRTLSVPVGVRVQVYFQYIATDPSNANTTSVYFSDLDATDEAPSTSLAPLAASFSSPASFNGSAGWQIIRTNTSAQIRSRTVAPAATAVLRIATLGWYDSRGQNA